MIMAAMETCCRSIPSSWQTPSVMAQVSGMETATKQCASPFHEEHGHQDHDHDGLEQVLVELLDLLGDFHRLVVRPFDLQVAGQHALEGVQGRLHVAGEGLDLRALDLPQGERDGPCGLQPGVLPGKGRLSSPSPSTPRVNSPGSLRSGGSSASTFTERKFITPGGSS